VHHYVYCIENLINGKVYVGKHTTSDLDDGYMGSGKLLTKAIAKHGVKNFCKHVLIECSSAEEAFELERQIVDEEFIDDENTYNLTLGGKGSWLAANKDPIVREGRKIRGKELIKRCHEIIWKSDSEFRKLHNERARKMLEIVRCDWTGRKHSKETKSKIGDANSVNQRGEKNSQFGTVWISHHDFVLERKIPKEELESWLDKGWTKGRK